MRCMPVYEQKWWRKLFKKKKELSHVDSLTDIEAMREFLRDLPFDVRQLQEDLQRLEELQQEASVAKEGVLQINLETQAKVLEEFLQHWEYFQSDVDINGERVKNLVQEFLHKAEKAHLKDLVEEKKQHPQWQCKW